MKRESSQVSFRILQLGRRVEEEVEIEAVVAQLAVKGEALTCHLYCNLTVRASNLSSSEMESPPLVSYLIMHSDASQTWTWTGVLTPHTVLTALFGIFNCHC